MPNGNGGAVVAWVDRRDYSHYIYAQNMTISGNAQWGNNGNLVSTEIDGLNYTTSPDPTNSAMLVSWATLNNFDYEIRAQKINVTDGTRGWPANGVVLCSVEGSKSEPVITHAGIAGAIVAWTDERNSGTTNLDIYAGLVVDGALPVSLTTFDAQQKNGDVLLQWTTSSEQNTSYFEIEHSKDGVVFSKIGNVRAAGNSTFTKDYVFNDRNAANGDHFYRLKIVDSDGKFTYSLIAKVTVSGRSTLQLFPNPAKDVLNIKVNGGNGNGMVQIFDLSGKKVKEQRMNINGNSVFKIDISQLPKGVFNLKFTNQKNTEQVKFLKQ